MTTLLLVLAGFLGGVFSDHWKPSLLFKKPPPTAEVIQLQNDYQVAQKALANANKAVADAQKEEREKLEAQIRAAQVDNAGTVAALAKAPVSPEASLAAKMAGRVSLKLSAAIGQLPADQQQAMVELIDQALSDKQAEVDAANAKLAKADADFKALTASRDQIAAQIPKLQAEASQSEQKAATVQAALTAKTTEVVTWADKTNQAEQKAGSLLGSLDSLWHWFLGIAAACACLYLLIHVAIPCWSQSFPNNKTLATLSAAAKNLTTAHS